jgi:hypothetical protein
MPAAFSLSISIQWQGVRNDGTHTFSDLYKDVKVGSHRMKRETPFSHRHFLISLLSNRPVSSSCAMSREECRLGGRLGTCRNASAYNCCDHCWRKMAPVMIRLDWQWQYNWLSGSEKNCLGKKRRPNCNDGYEKGALLLVHREFLICLFTAISDIGVFYTDEWLWLRNEPSVTHVRI